MYLKIFAAVSFKCFKFPKVGPCWVVLSPNKGHTIAKLVLCVRRIVSARREQKFMCSHKITPERL